MPSAKSVVNFRFQGESKGIRRLLFHHLPSHAFLPMTVPRPNRSLILEYTARSADYGNAASNLADTGADQGVEDGGPPS